MKKIITIVVAIVLGLLFVYTLYYLYEKDQEPDKRFTTAQPYLKDIVQQTVATGSVLPRNEIEIKPQVSGIIQKIYVEPGAAIKAGDLLAKIKVIPNMVNLNNAENRLERAKISLANAKTDYDRNKDLFDKGVIPQADFQQFDLNYKNAEQEVNAARENLQIVKEGVSNKSNQVSNTLIRATISGTVLDVPVEEGNSVIETNTFNEGTTIASVADLNDMIFEGKVDESEVGKLREGLEILLTIGAIEDREFIAQLEYISPKGVEEEGAIQFEIKAALEKTGEAYIRAGYSANAKIVLNRKDNVLAIKERWLEFQNDSAFVEIEIGEQKFEKRYVILGLSDGINVEVIEGLTADDKIKDELETIE